MPAEDETYDGAVVTQRFTGGELSYDSRAKTFTTVPPELAGQLGDLTIPDDPVASINAARRAAGGALGPLGAAEGEPYEIGSDGMGQDFVNGTIFYSPDTGANVVTGQVLAKYQSVGGPEGDLGFPITSEQDGGLAPASRISAFAAEDKPVIFWTPDHGAVIVRGAMNAAWDELGGATGELGAPVSDQTQNGDVITQRFSGGAISWDTVTQKFSTEPAGLAAQLAELEVPGAGPPQASSPTPQAAENTESSGLRWTWWWLLALVPLLLLGGLVGLAVLRKRRRRDEQFFGESESGPQHDQDDDGREDEVFGDRYAREGLGSLGAASSTGRDFGAEPPSFWGSPAVGDSAARDDEAPNVALGEQDDPDAVDTAPTRVVTVDPAPEATSAEDLSHDVVEGPDEADLDDSEVRDDSDSWDDRDGWDDSHDWDDRHDSDDRTDRDDRADRADWADWAHRDLDDADRAGLGDFAAADRDEAEFDRRPPAAPVLPPPAPPVHDAITDTGRHARIDIDEPTPLGTALHMPFDDPAEIPDGYPIKADTKSGLFWTPDSSDYDEAPVEIWFASEEIARTNGFVRGE